MGHVPCIGSRFFTTGSLGSPKTSALLFLTCLLNLQAIDALVLYTCCVAFVHSYLFLQLQSLFSVFALNFVYWNVPVTRTHTKAQNVLWVPALR